MEHIPAEFSGISLNIIERDGRRWLTAQQIGLALGFDESNARKNVSKLYERHGDEFTDRDTCVVNLTTQSADGISQHRTTRIFSESGCNKLGFFAGTKRAKEFRTWAAESLASPSSVSCLPSPASLPGALDQLTARLDDQACSLAELWQAVAAQNTRLEEKDRALARLHLDVDAARRGQLAALTKLSRLQERQMKCAITQEKHQAKETILRLEAEGVPRDVIAMITGRTFNHIRQVIFRARQEGAQ
jgi:hypothetical protein